MKRALLVLFVALVLTGSLLSTAQAVMDPETRQALMDIRRDLADIKKNQQAILDGQQKLSEEHKQLRYWIYNK